MKRGRMSVTAAAGVLTLSALIGITGASAASAESSTYHHLCVANGSESICADADGLGNPIAMLWSGDPSKSETNWYFPSPAGDVDLIKQANTSNCMQLEHQDSGGNVVDIVRLAPCQPGEAAEEWINSYDTYHGTDMTQFISLWALDNYGTDYCMTWLDGLSASEPVIRPCQGGDYTQDWRNY